MSRSWQLFLCYRQDDGSDTADWLYRNLNGCDLPEDLTDSRELPSLEIYFDQAAPATSDWHDSHKAALEDSKAFIIVLTPGLYSNLGADDWVHMEIDWWLQHREASPILIDATGKGDRWIPDVVKTRWPNAQRVGIDVSSLQEMAAADRTAKTEITIQRVLGGISASEAKERSADAERQRLLTARLKRFFATSVLALSLAVALLVAVLWLAFQSEKAKTDLNQQLALTLMDQAEETWASGDKVSAQVLAARARTHSQSTEIRHRYEALQSWMEGDFRSAQEHLEHLLASDFDRALAVASLSQPVERLARSRFTRRALDSLLAVSAHLRENRYNEVLRFKGLGDRIDATRQHQLLSDPGGASIFADLQDAQSEIARLMYYDFSDEELLQWTKDFGKTSRNLAEVYERFTLKLKAEGLTSQWQEIQSHLTDTEAIVDYFFYRESYAVWILKSRGQPIRFELGDAFSLEREARNFRDIISQGRGTDGLWVCQGVSDRELQSTGSPSALHSSSSTRGIYASSVSSGTSKSEVGPECQPRSEAARFRDRIWGDVDRALDGSVETVYLVPSGVLATVPFLALPGSKPGTYLIDEKLVVHLAAAQDLRKHPAREDGKEEPEKPVKEGRGVLMLGGVDYGSPAREINPRSLAARLHELPGTLREIEMIERRLRDQKGVRPLIVHRGSAAKEEAFRADASGRKIIHIATHAWAGHEDNREIRATRNLSVEDVEAYLAALDPALRAGFALAPVSEDETDGFTDGAITALEISSLDFKGVELVVLSGCDTVGSRLAGDSAVGLFSAFRAAGVGSVVASLYAVQDEPTADLMARFYRKLLTTNDPAIALRIAALEMKSQNPNPAYWAGFAAYAPFRAEQPLEEVPQIELR